MAVCQPRPADIWLTYSRHTADIRLTYGWHTPDTRPKIEILVTIWKQIWYPYNNNFRISFWPHISRILGVCKPHISCIYRLHSQHIMKNLESVFGWISAVCLPYIRRMPAVYQPYLYPPYISCISSVYAPYFHRMSAVCQPSVNRGTAVCQPYVSRMSAVCRLYIRRPQYVSHT